MRGRKDYNLGELVGFGGAAAIAVRETRWGFVIQSSGPEGAWRHLVERGMRLVVAAVWLAVLGLWLLPTEIGTPGTVATKILASVALVGLALVGVVLSRRMDGYAVQIDTNRRELRAATVSARGESWIKASFRFDEIGEAVLKRGRDGVTARSLGLCLKHGGKVIPVAVGDEAILLAVHDRLMRELRPMNERMASYRMPRAAGRKRPSVPKPPAAKTARQGRRANLAGDPAHKAA